MSKPEMTELNPVERRRNYTFPGGQVVELREVQRLAVSASGTHRLETQDGLLHIVPTGWIHIEIAASDWTM